MSMNTSLITMHVEADDVVLAPHTATELIRILCPFVDSWHQLDVAIVCVWVRGVYLLFAKGQPFHHFVVATEDDVHQSVRTVLSNLVGMLCIHVRFEAQFIVTLLEALMKWNRIGTKRHKIASFDDFKVEVLA